MSVIPAATVVLSDSFAQELPEMAVRWQAEASPEPQLLVLNDALAGELGLDAEWLRSTAAIGLLTGTVIPDGATPVAQAYAGHQFGGFVPRLGDGRALLLGELAGADGATKRPAPQGLRTHAVRPRRRRSGRGRSDAARVHHQRGDARAGDPHHPIAGCGGDRSTGAARDPAARRGARPRCQQSSARRQLPVRRRA